MYSQDIYGELMDCASNARYHEMIFLTFILDLSWAEVWKTAGAWLT